RQTVHAMALEAIARREDVAEANSVATAIARRCASVVQSVHIHSSDGLLVRASLREASGAVPPPNLEAWGYFDRRRDEPRPCNFIGRKPGRGGGTCLCV